MLRNKSTTHVVVHLNRPTNKPKMPSTTMQKKGITPAQEQLTCEKYMERNQCIRNGPVQDSQLRKSTTRQSVRPKYLLLQPEESEGHLNGNTHPLPRKSPSRSENPQDGIVLSRQETHDQNKKMQWKPGQPADPVTGQQQDEYLGCVRNGQSPTCDHEYPESDKLLAITDIQRPEVPNRPTPMGKNLGGHKPWAKHKHVGLTQQGHAHHGP